MLLAPMLLASLAAPPRLPQTTVPMTASASAPDYKFPSGAGMLFFYVKPDKITAVIVVDDKATAKQKEALVDFVKNNARRSVGGTRSNDGSSNDERSNLTPRASKFTFARDELE